MTGFLFDLYQSSTECTDNSSRLPHAAERTTVRIKRVMSFKEELSESPFHEDLCLVSCVFGRREHVHVHLGFEIFWGKNKLSIKIFAKFEFSLRERLLITT